jgi:hypothetical protein
VATDEIILDTQLVKPPAGPTSREVPLGRRFTVGGVLGTTFSVWWRHVLAFTVLSFVVYAPFGVTFGAFYRALLPSSTAPARADEMARLGVTLVAAWGVTILLSVIQAGAVTYGTVRHLSGERARFGEMVRVGLRRGLPVVGIGIVLWVAVMAGLVLLVVPGVMLMVATSVAVPAAVVERPGVLGAIRRSLALTRGRRWPLFAAGLSILVIMWVLAAVVQVGATVLSMTILAARRGPQMTAVLLVASQLGNVLFSALPLVAMSVAYHDLRAEKEGVDTAALARVFE